MFELKYLLFERKLLLRKSYKISETKEDLDNSCCYTFLNQNDWLKRLKSA